MKTVIRFFLVLLLQSLWISHAAAENGNIMACGEDLRGLLLPALTPKNYKADLHATITEKNGAVYTVKMYIPVTGPDKDIGPGGRQMTMGWVNLDTEKNIALEMQPEDGEYKKMKVDAREIRDYVSKCLKGKSPARQAGDEIVTTRLPIRLDKLADCEDADLLAKQCIDHYHEYDIDWIDADIRGDFDSSIKAFFLLPSLGELKIVLAVGDGGTDTLYVFRNKQLLTKETLAVSTRLSRQSFDINKDYLVTTYLRTGKDITRETRISKVAHMKLGADGAFTVCPPANPACQ